MGFDDVLLVIPVAGVTYLLELPLFVLDEGLVLVELVDDVGELYFEVLELVAGELYFEVLLEEGFVLLEDFGLDGEEYFELLEEGFELLDGFELEEEYLELLDELLEE